MAAPRSSRSGDPKGDIPHQFRWVLFHGSSLRSTAPTDHRLTERWAALLLLVPRSDSGFGAPAPASVGRARNLVRAVQRSALAGGPVSRRQRAGRLGLVSAWSGV